MKQSEIWLVSLDPTVGSKIRKTRTVIIVNDNTLGKLPLKILMSDRNLVITKNEAIKNNF